MYIIRLKQVFMPKRCQSQVLKNDGRHNFCMHEKIYYLLLYNFKDNKQRLIKVTVVLIFYECFSLKLTKTLMKRVFDIKFDIISNLF